MRKKYEEWLKQQPIYKTLVYQHGSQTLIYEHGAYKMLAVEVGYQSWSANYAAKQNAISMFWSKCRTVEGLLKKGKEQQKQIDECQCAGCQRKNQNLGGYQPCSSGGNIQSPPRKP